MNDVEYFHDVLSRNTRHPSTQHPSTELYPPPTPPYPRLDPKIPLKTSNNSYREMSDILIYR